LLLLSSAVFQNSSAQVRHLRLGDNPAVWNESDDLDQDALHSNLPVRNVFKLDARRTGQSVLDAYSWPTAEAYWDVGGQPTLEEFTVDL